MRRSLFGVVLGTFLVLGITVAECLSEGDGLSEGNRLSEPTAAMERAIASYVPTSSLPSSNLVTHVPPAEGGPQAIVVVDPGQRVLALYHVDKTTGEIALRSVRNITWDLQMVEFNSGKPLPQEIRNMRSELPR